MSKKIFSLLLVTLSISAFNSCSSPEAKAAPRPTPQIRTASTNVVCHNCQASFKVSMKAMKSGAVIKCPVCHHNYKTKVN